MGAEHDSERSCDRLLAGRGAGDDGQQVGPVWSATQSWLPYRWPDWAPTERHLLGGHHSGQARAAEILGRKLDSLTDEPLVLLRVSNRATATSTLRPKMVQRLGCHFSNFANYRRRLLLPCVDSWQTPRANSIRGRLPRLAA